MPNIKLYISKLVKLLAFLNLDFYVIFFFKVWESFETIRYCFVKNLYLFVCNWKCQIQTLLHPYRSIAICTLGVLFYFFFFLLYFYHIGWKPFETHSIFQVSLEFAKFEISVIFQKSCQAGVKENYDIFTIK